MKEENFNMLVGLFLGILIGIMFFGCTISYSNRSNMIISQETANDICKNLVPNQTVTAETSGYKLVCVIPSYDSTTNIIVREAN